eukprot:806598_1
MHANTGFCFPIIFQLANVFDRFIWLSNPVFVLYFVAENVKLPLHPLGEHPLGHHFVHQQEHLHLIFALDQTMKYHSQLIIISATKALSSTSNSSAGSWY